MVFELFFLIILSILIYGLRKRVAHLESEHKKLTRMLESFQHILESSQHKTKSYEESSTKSQYQLASTNKISSAKYSKDFLVAYEKYSSKDSPSTEVEIVESRQDTEYAKDSAVDFAKKDSAPSSHFDINLPTSFSFERFFTQKAMVVLGGIFFVLAAFFCVIYSIENNLVTPEIRIAGAIIFGFCLFLCGVVFGYSKNRLDSTNTHHSYSKYF